MHMKMEIKLVIIFHHHHDEKNKQTQYSMKKRKQTKKDGGKYAEHNMKNMNVFFGNMQADEFQIDILFHFFFLSIIIVQLVTKIFIQNQIEKKLVLIRNRNWPK